MMGAVAIYARSHSQWSVLRLVKDELRRQGTAVHVICDEGLAAQLPSRTDADSVVLPEYRPQQNPVQSIVSNLWTRLWLEWRCRGNGLSRIAYRAHFEHFTNRIAYYRRLLRANRTGLLIVGEDGPSGEIWLIAAAQQLGVPTLVVPYEASGKEDFVNLILQKVNDGTFNKVSSETTGLLRKLGEAASILESPVGSTTLYPAEYLCALHDVGIRIPNPWTTHGGQADLIAAESVGMLQHYLDEGLPSDKCVVAGTPYADRIFQGLRREDRLWSAYANGTKIEAGKTKILVALPPSYHDGRGHLCSFPTYQEMCRSIAEDLTSLDNVELTFVVHPAYRQQADILSGMPEIRLSTDWILDLIPQHDVFFVTTGSSTLRWSALARKPSINLDYYKFRLKFFEKVDGVLGIETRTDFLDAVRRLNLDNDHYRAISAKQIACGSKWGTLDGGNTDRLIRLVYDTMQ